MIHLLAQATQPTTQQAADVLLSTRNFWLPPIVAVLTAASVDLHSYEQGPGNAPFKWKLFFVRIISAALGGFLISLGAAAVPKG